MVSMTGFADPRSLLPALLSTFVLLACASPEPAPRDRFYVLDTRPPADRSVSTGAPWAGATLLVNDLATRGFLGGRQIVYRNDAAPLEVRRYPQHLWEEPPGRALAAELVAALRATDLFQFVLGAEQRSRSDYLLGGELARFEHRPTTPQPRVAADFTLTLMRGSDRRTLLTKRYQGEEPTDGATPEAMVRAFNRLSTRLIGEAVSDLSRLRGRLQVAKGRR